MAEMDDGSMVSRRSAWAFGIVAAISIVLLIVIGATGENVGLNTRQANVESSHSR